MKSFCLSMWRLSHKRDDVKEKELNKVKIDLIKKED